MLFHVSGVGLLELQVFGSLLHITLGARFLAGAASQTLTTAFLVMFAFGQPLDGRTDCAGQAISLATR
jgi:hypothetical protein